MNFLGNVARPFDATQMFGRNIGLGAADLRMQSGVPNFNGIQGGLTSNMSPNFGRNVTPQSAGGGMNYAALFSALGQANAANQPQVSSQQFSGGGRQLDPLYLLKQYAPSVAARFTPRGLLG